MIINNQHLIGLIIGLALCILFLYIKDKMDDWKRKKIYKDRQLKEKAARGTLYKYADKESIISATPITDIRTILNETAGYDITINSIYMCNSKLNEMLCTEEVQELIKKPNLRKLKRYMKKNKLPKIVIGKETK